MLLYTAILSALAPPFLLIVLGYALKRLRVMHPAHVPILNDIVLNVTLPALILLGLLRAPALSPRLALPVGATVQLLSGGIRAYAEGDLDPAPDLVFSNLAAFVDWVLE